MNGLTDKRNIVKSFSLLLTLMAFFSSIPVFAEQTTEPNSNDSRPTNEARVYARTGHYVGGYLGYSRINSTEKSNWPKGSSRDGIGWQVEYTWIPSKHCDYKIFSVPCALGLGALYSGYHVVGTDDFYVPSQSGNVEMPVMLNYLGIEGTLKLLSRSDRWEFNIRCGLGLAQGISQVEGKSGGIIHSYYTTKEIKIGFGMSTRFSAQYNLSKRVALYINVTGIWGKLKPILSKTSGNLTPNGHYVAVEGFGEFKEWTVNPTFALGATYRFGPSGH